MTLPTERPLKRAENPPAPSPKSPPTAMPQEQEHAEVVFVEKVSSPSQNPLNAAN